MSMENYLDLELQKLPSNFADQLLDLELKIDTDEYSIPIMQKLN